MNKTKILSIAAAAVVGAGAWLLARRGGETSIVVLGGFTAPREAYHELIPRFQRAWFDATGKRVEVRESYLGSGAQSRAIAAGFPADVAALSLESDIVRLERAGLITREWRTGKTRGIVTASVVALAVRKGNPEKIRTWEDLARPGLEILTPNPKTSGGAQWNFLALYGAAERGEAGSFAPGDEGAFRFCRAVFSNILVLDKGARESLINFERGLGDVAVSYESEILAARLAGSDIESVVPRSTILIENPVAVVDANAEKHGVREEAEAFVRFLLSPEAQEVFARHGFRPADPSLRGETKVRFPPVPDLWSIEEFGGWEEAGTVFFGPGGVFDQVMEDVHASLS